MVDMAVGEQDLLDRHTFCAGRRLQPVEIAAGIGEGAPHRPGAPDQAAILLERRHRDDHGAKRRFGHCRRDGSAAAKLQPAASPVRGPRMALSHLQRLEAEAIHIFREAVAETRAAGHALFGGQGQLGAAPPRPQGLPSRAAAFPSAARRHDVEVPGDVRASRPRRGGGGDGADRPPQPRGGGARDQPVRPWLARSTPRCGRPTGSSRRSTSHRFDAAFGGARRDEERARAKERIFSFRSAGHRWDPKRQRPELWRLYNARKAKGESFRIFPISNWTELDVWQYVEAEGIEVVRALFRRAAADGRARRHAAHGRRRAAEAAPGRGGREALGPLPHARLLSRSPARSRARRRPSPELIEEMRARPHVRAPGPPHRPRRRRLDGAQEARGLFLMAHVSRLYRDRNRRAYLEAPRSTRSCCASSPAARSTTASRP